MNKAIIRKLANYYSCEDIAIQLDSTIQEIRVQLKEQLPMTEEAWQEVDALFPDSSDVELSLLYNTSLYNIRNRKAVKKQLSKLELKSLGDTHEDIAKVLGKSRSWVTSKLKESKKNSIPNKIKDWDAVLEFRKSNSLQSTAKKFGVSSAAICQYFKRNKVEV
jgi:hypothetical protein